MRPERKSGVFDDGRRPGRFAWRFVAVLLFVGLSCAFSFAQSTGSGDTGPADEDSSRKVDESEESYRTRMELRDQRYREQKRADMIYTTPGGTSKMDELPEASREHIKDQMRDMIIASRQWKPGEDVSDYPYEPSEAARTDPQLLKQERAAWAEQLEKYQQREAAAYASAQKAGQQGDSGAGREGADGAEGNERADAESAAKGGSPSRSSRSPGEYSDRERAEEAVSTAGVSENALSFLQKAGGQMAETPKQSESADGTAKPGGGGENQSERTGASPDETVTPGSLAVADLARLQGMSSSENDSAGSASSAPASESPAESAEKASSPDAKSGEEAGRASDTPAPAGTLTIDELERLGSSSTRDAGVATEAAPAGSNAEKVPPVERVEPEPGTLEIEQLKQLNGSGQ